MDQHGHRDGCRVRPLGRTRRALPDEVRPPLRRQSPQRRHRPRPRPLLRSPPHKPHTSAPHPQGGGADSAAASRRRHLRRWLAALHQAVADGRWGRRSFGVWNSSCGGGGRRQTQTIDLRGLRCPPPVDGHRHGSGPLEYRRDPADAPSRGRPIPATGRIEPGAGVDPDRYELRIPDEYVDNLPDEDDLPALSYGVHPAFAVFSSLATFRVFRLLDRATAASAPALAGTAHVSIRTVRSVMKELRVTASPDEPRRVGSGVDEVSTASHHVTAPVAGCDASSAPGGPNARPGEQSLVFPHAHVQVDLSAGPVHPLTRLRPHPPGPGSASASPSPEPDAWDEAEALLRRVLGAARIEPQPA